jgi:hypothetical protein
MFNKREKSYKTMGYTIRFAGELTGFHIAKQIEAVLVSQVSRLFQSTRSSNSLIPCRYQFSYHGIDVFCLAGRNKCHEKYH